jgi:hypothetical protein
MLIHLGKHIYHHFWRLRDRLKHRHKNVSNMKQDVITEIINHLLIFQEPQLLLWFPEKKMNVHKKDWFILLWGRLMRWRTGIAKAPWCYNKQCSSEAQTSIPHLSLHHLETTNKSRRKGCGLMRQYRSSRCSHRPVAVASDAKLPRALQLNLW